MANAHRKLGECVEVFTREGGWVVQRVVPEGEGYDVEVLRGGMDTKEEALAIARSTTLPTFELNHDPNVDG